MGSKYSADIELYLMIDDRRIKLAQVAPDFVVLRDAISLPRTRADVSIVINGEEWRYTVYLKNGAVPFDNVVEYERLSA